MSRIEWAILVCHLLPPLAAPAQDNRPHFRVLDSETGDPIPYVSVVLDGGSREILTDTDGSFAILEISPGKHRLVLRRIGYRELVTEFVWDPENPGILEFLLQPVAYVMPGVIVTPGTWHLPLHGAGGLHIMGREKIKSLPNPEDDVVRALQRLPGISATEFSARLHVRGGRDDELVARFEGLELRDPFHIKDFGGVFSIFHLEAVDEIDLYLGGYPARYGDRLSGVMDVSLADVSRKPLGGSLIATLGSTRGSLHAPWKDTGSLLVTARYSYLYAMLDGYEEGFTIRPRFADVGLRLQSPNPAWSFHLLGTWDDLYYDEPYDEKDLDTDYRNLHLWARHNKALGRGGNLQSVCSLGLFDQDRLVGVGGRDERRVAGGAIRQEGTLSRPQRHLVGFGWGFQYQSADIEIVETRVTRIEDGQSVADTIRVESGSPRQWKAHGYVQDRWRLLPALRLSLGVRFDAQEYTAYPQWSPRAAAAWNPGLGLTLRAAWGRFFQSPDLTDPFLGNLKVAPENATHYVAGVDKSLGSKAGVRIEGYLKEYGAQNVPINVVMAGEVRQIKPESARARGIEFFGSLDLSRSFSLWASYTFSRATWSSGGRSFDQSFDRKHEIAIDLGIKPGSDWEAHASWSYHTGTPYTEELWISPPSTPGQNWTLITGSTNGSRYPDFHRLDLRVRRFFRWSKKSLVINAEVVNIYNRDNVRHYSWMFDRTSPTTYEPTRVTRTYFPFFPSLGLEFYF